MRRALFLVVLLVGCSSLSEPWRTTAGPQPTPVDLCLATCVKYDNAYLIEYALGMTMSGVSAAAGTSGILSTALADEPGAAIGLAAIAAGAGVATLVFNWLAGENASRYTACVDMCRKEVGDDSAP